MDYLGFEQARSTSCTASTGVLLVETLHLFPLMTLSIVDAMGKISPSLDEAAESVGSRGLRKFWDITFPLTTPGYVSGALLVFIWTFADFATPLVVGVDDLLASQAYLNIVQFVDRRLFKMGIVISAIMVILAILFLIIAKKYVSIKDYSSLSYSVIERKKLSPRRRWGWCSSWRLILILAFIPYLGHRARLLRQGLGPDALPGEVHAPVFRTGGLRDAQVHHQQPALCRDLGRDLHRRGGAAWPG
ncbi:MAG: ABC transporter permease subunit [Desulfobacterales bacterium]|nr:ABC transporter permease subunit [Desulfobacterales bacterium]